MDKIIQVKPGENHTLAIVTSSGIRGIFDMKPYLQGPVFQPLLDQDYFRQVRPSHHGIAWPDEQDISSDTIIWDLQHADNSGAT